jgi:hypothetical protein
MVRDGTGSASDYRASFATARWLVIDRRRDGLALQRTQQSTRIADMSGALDKYLGIVLMAVVLYYIFSDASGTTSILNSLSDFNQKAIGALQGRRV